MLLRQCIKRLIEITAVGGLLIVASLLLMVHEASAIPITIDMSTHGPGPFDKNFFKSKGVVFTAGGCCVALVQGDQAVGNLGGRISGLFAPSAVTSISVLVAPGFQGTTVFRLAALDVLSDIIASKSILVTEDLGDPEHSGFGYRRIELSSLPGAVGFFVDNTFVRSSFATNTDAGFGLSSMTFNTVSFSESPSPVPEPATLLLLGTTAAGLGLARWRQRRRKQHA